MGRCERRVCVCMCVHEKTEKRGEADRHVHRHADMQTGRQAGRNRAPRKGLGQPLTLALGNKDKT